MIRLFYFLCGLLFSSVPLVGSLAANDSLAAFDRQAPLEINADNAFIDRDKQVSHFSGNVVVKQGPMTLSSDTMTVHYILQNASGSGSTDISKIEVNGNVRITRGLNQAQGDEGVYDAKENILHLKGNVVLSQRGNILKGNALTYNMRNDTTEIVSDKTPSAPKGRVKAIIVPSQIKKP